MRHWLTILLAAALTGCGTTLSDDDGSILLLRVDGRTGAPGIVGSVRAALGMGIDVDGCYLLVRRALPPEYRVKMRAGECSVEVE